MVSAHTWVINFCIYMERYGCQCGLCWILYSIQLKLVFSYLSVFILNCLCIVRLKNMHLVFMFIIIEILVVMVAISFFV